MTAAHAARRGTCALALLLLAIALCAPAWAEVDYQGLQEDPLETALRKLAAPDGIEWEDKEVMITGGAPEIVKQMRWPLASFRRGRGFSRKKRHTGIDLLAPAGAPVYAVLDGTVEVVSNGGAGFRGYGKVVVINHGGELWTLYSHNSANLVKIGQKVKQGDVIAKVGRTGRATANHVHFEVRNAKGTPMDPMKHLPKE